MNKPKDKAMLWVYLVYALWIVIGTYMLVEWAVRPFGQWTFPF